MVQLGERPELDHVLEAAQLLRRHGVLVLRDVVRQPLLGDCERVVKEWYARFVSGEVQNYSLGEETATVVPKLWGDAFTKPRTRQSFRKWNVVGLDHRILPIIDAAPLYDVVHAFIGPDLMATKTQMIVVPSGCSDSPYLHTDAGSMADVVESMNASPVMVSAQVFLSDLPTTGMGNFTCVVGSHTERFPWPADNADRTQLTTTPLGASIPFEVRRQVTVTAGDVVLFMHSLWHGVSSNSSATDRLSLILSYAKTFVRPYDYNETPATVIEHGTIRQRLLFGELGGWAWRPGCFYHLPDDYLRALEPDSLRTLAPSPMKK